MERLGIEYDYEAEFKAYGPFPTSMNRMSDAEDSDLEDLDERRRALHKKFPRKRVATQTTEADFEEV